MTDKTFDITAHTKTLETLVALDVGFGCLLENIRNMHPATAQSLATDLLTTAQRIPQHLPSSAHGAADILERWAAILRTPPSHLAPDRVN